MAVKLGDTALYRLYDAQGRLLYVGISRRLRNRWNQHSMVQPWWHLVARRDVEWCSDRATAELAETKAIATEGPIYNKDQVPNAKIHQGEYDDTEDRRRIKRLLRRDAKRHYFHVGRSVYLPALAERYSVSVTTLWSVMRESAGGHHFEGSRQRATVRVEPKF